MTSPMLASEIFAKSQNAKCTGNHLCHWCGAPCSDLWIHDDHPPIPFGPKSTAKYRGNPYICVGCWLWKRKRVSVVYLNGVVKDAKTAEQVSWFITDTEALGIEKGMEELLYARLMNPPNRFSLILTDWQQPVPTKNLLHLAIANDIAEIHADTPLQFTIHNIPHTYTIYELDQAIRNGETGKEPGSRALLRLFPYTIENDTPRPKPQRGRPPAKDVENGKVTKKLIRLSGAEVEAVV